MLADAAIANAETDDLAYVRAHAFALKTDIAQVQGRKEDAAQFARDAFAADASELQSQMAMAQVAFGGNNIDEGIRILEQAKEKAISRLDWELMERFARKAQVPSKLLLETARETIERIMALWPTFQKELPLDQETRRLITAHMKSVSLLAR